MENAAKSVMASDAEFRWCLSPQCASGQYHNGSGRQNLFTCHACKSQFCVLCDHPWHRKETCNQYQQRLALAQIEDEKAKTLLEQESASKEALKQDTKICPGQGCGRRVQKVSGCDHVTCKFSPSYSDPGAALIITDEYARQQVPARVLLAVSCLADRDP